MATKDLSQSRNIASFYAFIWEIRQNRLYLISAIGVTCVLWIIFKILYPYPNIIFDSYNYIKAADLNWTFNAWPIGYSKILQLFWIFSHSANLLVSLQYFFLEFSCLLFFFTWLYLLRPSVLVKNGLFIFLFLNPIFIFCSNYILSDPIFVSLSLIWIALLLWVIYRPRLYMIFVNALLVVLAFTIRYSAMYYPIIVTLAFILSHQRVGIKIVGILLPILLMGWFTIYTSTQTAKVTGQKQFSAFGGWKVANDALYFYSHLLSENTDTVPKEFKLLDKTVRDYFKVANDSADLLNSDFTSGSYYMFMQHSPLVNYMQSLYGGHVLILNSKPWLSVGPLYQAYGFYLIRKYPIAFGKYFLLPNLIRYAMPPGEIFGSTSPFELDRMNQAYLGVYLQRQFGLKAIKFSPYSVELSVNILSVYPRVMAIVHSLFILGILGFIASRGFTMISKPYKYFLFLIICLWLVDFGFSVFSAGIVLRYQLFIMVPELAVGLFFLDYSYRNLDKKEVGVKSDNLSHSNI